MRYRSESGLSFRGGNEAGFLEGRGLRSENAKMTGFPASRRALGGEFGKAWQEHSLLLPGSSFVIWTEPSDVWMQTYALYLTSCSKKVTVQIWHTLVPSWILYFSSQQIYISWASRSCGLCTFLFLWCLAWWANEFHLTSVVNFLFWTTNKCCWRKNIFWMNKRTNSYRVGYSNKIRLFSKVAFRYKALKTKRIIFIHQHFFQFYE